MFLARASCLAMVSLVVANLPGQTFFPPPSAPVDNPITASKALLGMALFWEEQMSSANTTACGTCHVFSTGGADPRGTSQRNPGPDGVYYTADDITGSTGVPSRDANGRYLGSAFGVGMQVTPRKAPTVVNAAYRNRLFYDGRAEDGTFTDPVSGTSVMQGPVALENLIKGPPVNTVEMGHVGRNWTDVANKIATARPLALASNIPPRLASFIGSATTYNELFATVYGQGATATPTRIIMALATYVRTLVSDQSPYDYYLANQGTLTAAEQRGLTKFNATAGGIAGACSRCHAELTAQSHVVGPNVAFGIYYGPQEFHNTGVRPVAEDPGRFVVSSQSPDMGKFRVPGLRNTGLHLTWFHNGQFATLGEVIDFYDRGGDFHVNQSTDIVPRNFTAQEKSDLEAFLNSLTDPRLANELPPFDRPRLGSETNAAPTTFGTSMVGTAGLSPRMVAHEPILVGGRRATIAVENAPANAPAFMMWDSAAVQQGFTYAGVHLHLAIYDFSASYVGLTQANAVANGFASYSFDVPAVAALRGYQFYAQWAVVDPATPAGISTSNAARIVLR